MLTNETMIGLIIEPIRKFYSVNFLGSDHHDKVYRTRNWYYCFYLLGNEKRILLYSENVELTRRKKKIFFASLEFNLSLDELKDQYWFEHMNKRVSFIPNE